MSTGSIVGLDIGGRNIKYVVLTPTGSTYQAIGGIVHPTHMKLELKHVLKRLLARIAGDIFFISTVMSYPTSCKDYQKGVETIVDMFLDIRPKAPVSLVDFQGNLWSLKDALHTDPTGLGATNFFGSLFLASKIQSPAIVMDTGSTSTDILFVTDNGPNIIGRDTSNVKRSFTGETTWTGIIYTLINSLTHFVPIRGRLVRGSPRGGSVNAVYNILNYEEMGKLLRMYGIKQKELDDYYVDIAAFFGCDLMNIGRIEIDNIAHFVSIKHIEVVVESLLQVVSWHKMNLRDIDFILMGIGKDILLKKVLNLFDIPKSQIFDAADHVPGDLWAYGSALGAALRGLDHVTGENVPISSIKYGVTPSKE